MASIQKTSNVSESTRLRLDGIINSGYSVPSRDSDPILDYMETDTMGSL
ncbi:hypothetical protein HY637_04580 [Candidatus Woesearchaeota archaeon]|nr:hypothetical protein [Candidatus Woesearchaeota archaeon]